MLAAAAGVAGSTVGSGVGERGSHVRATRRPRERKGRSLLAVATVPAAAVAELAPELGRLYSFGEDEGVEDDDGGVRDDLDKDELGPEDVVLLVVKVLPESRDPERG